MKHTTLTTPPLLEWPRLSIKDFMDVDIEFGPARIFYNSFFYIFWVAGTLFSAYRDVFISDPTIQNSTTSSIGMKLEKELISLFDKAYSLDEK